MKKFLSMFLAVLLIFSVMAPITAFAENGPYPNDFENINFDNLEDLLNLKMSAVMFIDYNAILGGLVGGLEDSENVLDGNESSIENAIGLVYPADEEMPLPEIFSGASYDLETNTLTLNNVKSKNAILGVLGMGDDFKINLVGYNEFAAIMSSGMEWGGSVTLTGSGELVLGRSEEAFITGVTVEADNTASVFHVEDTVKLKVYSKPDFYMDAISVIGSTVLDSAELIKLGGTVVADEPDFKTYIINTYEQLDAYDLEWNNLEYYELGLKKGDTYYVADEHFDEETFEYTGEYDVYSISYDELLGCYTATPYANGEPVSLSGFTILTEYEPIYDESLGYYVGYTYYAEEFEGTYKNVFYPFEKEPFDLCVDENGTKYGFWQYTYEYDDEAAETETYVYNLIEHPTYGLIAIEDETKTTLDGLTPLIIEEKEYADSYISSDVVVNNGGSVVEPKTIKGIKTTNHKDGVKVSWTADSSADKYRIYRKTSKNGDWKKLGTIDADETSFIDKTAKSGSKYYYTVRGYNYVGWGSYNATGVSITHIGSPKVTAKNISKGIYLSWSKIAKADKYRIYRQTNGSSKWTLIDTVKGTSFTDKTAKSGTKYNYRVRAVTGSTVSGYNTVGRYYLSTPTLSSVKNSSSGATVTWKKVTGAAGYKVYRKTGSGDWKLIATTTNNTKFTYTDKTAKSGKTYSYSVQAYYSKTTGTYNTTGLKLKYLAAPQVKKTVYTKTIKLSWDKISGAKEYAVYRKASGESSWKKVATTSKLYYKDTAVKNNKTYSYRVRAINGKTTSAYKTIKQLFLSTPTLSSVKNTTTGVSLTWKKVSGAEGYKIYRKTGSGSWKLIKTTTNNTKFTYTDNNLSSGKTYTYTVRAYNGSYTSYYNKTGLKIKTKTVKQPNMNSLINVENGVQVAWMPVSGADKYYVYRQLDGAENWERLAIVSENELAKDQYGYLLYVDETAENGKIYGYAVRTYDNGILSDYDYAPNKYTTYLDPVDVITAEATADGILLEWEEAEGTNSYVILRKAEGADGFSFINPVTGAFPNTAVDTGVIAGTTYTYAVCARTTMNNGKDGMSAIGGTKTVTVQ